MNIRALILPAALFVLSGIASGIADIASTPAKYNKSAFLKWNPQWENGEYIGHKDQTWVNKWALSESGDALVGTNRFFLSSTALVGLTDLWHGARTLMLFFLIAGALFTKNPWRWWHYPVWYAAIVVCYSAGWNLANLALG